MPDPAPDYVSRAGHKLAAALAAFHIDVTGLTCADLGSSTGGFVDCLLQHGAARVFAVERGYGVLDFKLRRDPRVVVMERTNALTLTLPQQVQLVTIDAGWTRQRLILPAAARLLTPDGHIISLVKPHYEAKPEQLQHGILPPEKIEAVLTPIRAELASFGLTLIGETPSPLPGQAGNHERLWNLYPSKTADARRVGRFD